MIRKQIYVNEEQNLLLKYNAKTYGISEAMQIRMALDEFYKHTYEYDKNGVKIDTTPDFLKRFKESLKIKD